MVRRSSPRTDRHTSKGGPTDSSGHLPHCQATAKRRAQTTKRKTTKRAPVFATPFKLASSVMLPSLKIERKLEGLGFGFHGAGGGRRGV